MEFTSEQQRAIDTIDRNLLIVACAGSGKTEVLSRRIVRLLEQPDVEPGNIVAFTFTEKAAAELKERVHTRVKTRLGEVQGLAEMYIGTMHGYALDLLHSHVPEAFKYNVLSDVQDRLLIDRYSKESGLTTTNVHVNGKPPRPLRRYVESKLYQQVVSLLREDDIDVAELRKDVREGLYSYMRLLHRRRYFDYTGILAGAVALLDPDDEDEPESVISLRKHVESKVKYVVVDEYQDTNPIQEKLIRGLTQYGANLCVVGDDDQTIYQWRGSAVRNILTMQERYDDVAQVTLNENYRSSPAIIELARAIVEQIPDDERLTKRMVAAGHQTYDLGDLLALDFADPEQEAAWICDRIEYLRGAPFTDRADSAPRGLSWSDFAVLFRSVGKDAGPIVEQLRRRKIPYVIKGLSRLFETDEVRAAVAVFKFAAGEIEEAEVVDAWLTADLGLTEADIRRGLRTVQKAVQWNPNQPWDSVTLQGIYLDFLEALGLREETIPSAPGGGRGELVYYNLGRFSTAIGDFERIHLTTPPTDRILAFAKWLEFQAPGYYEESDADAGYAQPDAVTIATVHQAKGMQWPAVFVPALRKNTFPTQKHGGTSVFHIVDEHLVPDAARYKGTIEDERRLFYVAITRAQKYLALSFAPNGKKNGGKRSDFFDEAIRFSQQILTREPPRDQAAERLPAQPLHQNPDVVLSFSDLKYLFDCPYSFKLRLMYGFDSPLQKELGYGKSLHDAMAEIHKRAISGDIASESEAEALVDRHLNLPFANPAAEEQLRGAAVASVRRYLKENASRLSESIYSEQPVEIHAAPGVTVNGRIDLVRYVDTDKTAIVDFKSSERVQAEDVSRLQLHMYDLGFQELTGRSADLVEIVNLDKDGTSKREAVDSALEADIRVRVAQAGNDLRANRLPRLNTWCSSCANCDFVGVCRKRERS